MQSRKKLNLEVERKLKRQKRTYAAVFAAICLAIVMVIGWFVWDTQNRRIIMTFNGERIATNDFRLVSILNDTPINDFTRYEILEELKSFIMVMQMGEELGLGFTDEELENTATNAAFYREMIGHHAPGLLDFIDDRRLGDFLGLFEFVGSRLVDYLITDYEVYQELDEELYAEELERHIERLIQEGTEVLVQYMALDPWEDNTEVHFELSIPGEIDFLDIASRHCVLGTGLEPMDIHDFAMEFGVPIDAWLAGLPIGQFSPELHGSEYSFFFYVYNRIEPELDLEEITEIFREHFELSIRHRIFFERLRGWVADADVDINRRVFDTIQGF